MWSIDLIPTSHLFPSHVLLAKRIGCFPGIDTWRRMYSKAVKVYEPEEHSETGSVTFYIHMRNGQGQAD